MTTTGRGLGWPPPDSASRGNWNGKPDVGLGWPARPSRAGRTAFAVPGSAAAWHPPPGAGPTTPVGASAAFPGAITEVRPFAGISATGGQAAPAGPVRGYARPLVGGNGNAASSAAPERTRSVAPALAGATSSDSLDPVALAAAVAVPSMVAWRAPSEHTGNLLAEIASPVPAATVSSISIAHAAPKPIRARGDRTESWGSSLLIHQKDRSAESERWVQGWQRADERARTGSSAAGPATAATGARKEASAMRGSGVVQRGLGWPEIMSATSLLARRHASADWVAGVPRPLIDAPVVEVEAGVEHEGGVGWPVEPEGRHGRHALADHSGRERSAAHRAKEVSRETIAPIGWKDDTDSGPSRTTLSGRPPPADTPALGDHQTGNQTTETSRGAAAGGSETESAVASRRETTSGHEASKRARIPRHAVVRWSPQRPAGQPEQESPEQESPGRADIRSVAVGKRVWALPVEGPIRDARTSEGSDSPMIAGTYPGALSAPGESEDEVAIPAPDTSADTPIARAAQAAMKARAGGQAWPRPETCRILTIANQKGGVGKTTTAVNLAASLAMNGSRVLVVDLDPQGNASTALDVEHRSGTASIYNVLVDGQPLGDVIRPVNGFSQLFCAPATIDLAGSEIELVPLVAREARLARAVGGYDASGLDYIFIDCPPSLGLLTVNALVAAPEVLIPIQCEYYALEGLEQLLRTIDLVKSHLNPGLKVTTILLTMYDSRTRLASQVADEVRGHFGDLVLSSVIPRSVRVSEAPSYGQSVMTYDPGSSGALAYLEAAREMAFQSTESARS